MPLPFSGAIPTGFGRGGKTKNLTVENFVTVDILAIKTALNTENQHSQAKSTQKKN